jgi:hypothetical protein
LVPVELPCSGIDFKIGGKKINVVTFKVDPHSPWQSAAAQATGKYILYLDRAILRHPDTIANWVASAEAFAQVDSNSIAVSGIVEASTMTPSSRSMEWNVPFPNDPIWAILGKRSANIFAFWHRQPLLELAQRWPIDLSSEERAAELFLAILSEHKKLDIIPHVVVTTIQFETHIGGDVRRQLSKLDPLLNSPPKDWRRIVHYVYGLRQEYDDLYNNYKAERERADHYRRMCEHLEGHKKLGPKLAALRKAEDKLAQLEKMRSSILKILQ